jgi:hypothetical protein
MIISSVTTFQIIKIYFPVPLKGKNKAIPVTGREGP